MNVKVCPQCSTVCHAGEAADTCHCPVCCAIINFTESASED